MGRAVKGAWRPFRALGVVTNEIPVDVQTRGSKHFLTTCTGTSFQIFSCDKLRLLFVGTPTNAPITCIVSQKDFTFASCGASIIKFQRAREVQRFTIPDHSNEERRGVTVTHLVILGNLLVGLTSDNSVNVWHHISGEVEASWELGPEFLGVLLLHPPTLLNKILVAGVDGSMRLFNVRTSQLIHTFRPLRDSAVTFLSSTPVAGVVAVGFLDGSIALHDILMDERLMVLYQEDRVSSIAFRTDGATVMATGSARGDITLWDLEKRRVVAVMKGAHHGTVHSLHFFDGQPLLLSAGSDNSVKQWLFDAVDGVPRLLRSREGHGGSPTRIRFHDSMGKILLTAARDQSVRFVNIVRDAQCTELSQGKGLEALSHKRDVSVQELKLPVVTAMSSHENRQGEWDNMITAHLNDAGARTWDVHRKALGHHRLRTTDKKPVVSVAISLCGNFGFVGSSGGSVDMYNMQSGQHRRSFGPKGKSHDRAVTGVTSDTMNRVVITCSADGTIKFWDFNTADILDSVYLSSSASGLLLSPTGTLVAVTLDDWTVSVLDLDTRRIVRSFQGHKGAITDLAFTPDGRWLVSASSDSTVRTWDLPNGLCVDVFGVESVATSLAVSPTGEYLATSHIDNVGVFLWSNMARLTNISGSISQTDNVPVLSFPTTAFEDDSEMHASDELEITEDEQADEIVPDTNTFENGVTLSKLPKTRWHTLLNLDTIKARNKASQKVTEPEKVPFFLPTVAGAQPKLDVGVTDEDAYGSREVRAAESRILWSGLAAESEQNPLSVALRNSGSTGEFSSVFELISTWTPSALDFHIRTLSVGFESFVVSDENDTRDVELLLRCLQWSLDKKMNFEVCEALLCHTIRVHGDVLANANRTKEAVIEQLMDTHVATWQHLEQLFAYADCLTGFIRNST
ncbi:YVTN repeat-like/Quino protein amine dehydrogenase [Gonapodya prolifera JEL478]|uniref:YVTN repeat-like/Quino protein amine dehydrogenase n=1 Tax=Gonapodya prolifera (strain JEL478) TaxID=1344416 RepID=A0A139A0A7_GONPJ|nr:YVTN repeat-like/Quino protein amine dehydrogenase [Gonapodya prolifera JEL478]|eukprot:KXS10068.1 YVTN repeat-like/Quino protein amine dehydrogenase [Gonapodya prolifera JEL478]